jgi:formate-dependent phosphoribosylglycinamide formyltransferase (GAR transformylase)
MSSTNVVCMHVQLLCTSSFIAAMHSSLQPMQAFVELLYSCTLLQVNLIKQCSLVFKAVGHQSESISYKASVTPRQSQNSGILQQREAL